MKIRVAAGLVMLIAALTWAAPGPDSPCLACHDEKGAPFHASIHSVLGCTGCHTDIKGFPHPDQVAKVNCGACHSDMASALASSAHTGEPCESCHGDAHAIVDVKNSRSPVYPLNLPHTCGTCHGDKKFAQRQACRTCTGSTWTRSTGSR